MDRLMVYRLIYALAARDGRDRDLFGPHGSRGVEAFTCSAPGSSFPELWFELPLAGDPWFDLHVLTARGDLSAGNPPSPEACGGYPAVFDWFACADNGRQLALSWDLNAGDGRPAAAIQLLLSQRDDRTACNFLKAAGRPEAVPAYRAFLSRMPQNWFACYLGVFPSRPGHFLRVECIPSGQLQRAYAFDPSLLARHLSQVGFARLSDSLLSGCQALASAPFQFEFQFDVDEKGSAGAALGASVRFAVGNDASGRMQSFRVTGAAGALLEQLEKRGLADGRWRRLEETAFARRLTFGSESCLLFCAPVFIKLRWRPDRPPDAKAYLLAGVREQTR